MFGCFVNQIFVDLMLHAVDIQGLVTISDRCPWTPTILRYRALHPHKISIWWLCLFTRLKALKDKHIFFDRSYHYRVTYLLSLFGCWLGWRVPLSIRSLAGFGFDTIPRDKRQWHSSRVGFPNKRNNHNFLVRVHQHGRHDVQWRPAIRILAWHQPTY